MLYFVKMSSDGTITESLSGSVVLPGYTAITKEQADTIAASGQCRLVNGVLSLVNIPAPAPVDLATGKLVANRQIDDQAEASRLLFLTGGSGQALEYTATQADALRAIATGGVAAAADYPWLAAEQAAMAASGQQATINQIAQSVATIMASWDQIGAQIKRIRRTAKLQIDAAASMIEVRAACVVTWPHPP